MSKSDRTPTFEAEQDKVGPGWHVRIASSSYAPEWLPISGFNSEVEAQTWIDKDTTDWLAKLTAQPRTDAVHGLL